MQSEIFDNGRYLMPSITYDVTIGRKTYSTNEPGSREVPKLSLEPGLPVFYHRSIGPFNNGECLVNDVDAQFVHKLGMATVESGPLGNTDYAINQNRMATIVSGEADILITSKDTGEEGDSVYCILPDKTTYPLFKEYYSHELTHVDDFIRPLVIVGDYQSQQGIFDILMDVVMAKSHVYGDKGDVLTKRTFTRDSKATDMQLFDASNEDIKEMSIFEQAAYHRRYFYSILNWSLTLIETNKIGEIEAKKLTFTSPYGKLTSLDFSDDEKTSSSIAKILSLTGNVGINNVYSAGFEKKLRDQKIAEFEKVYIKSILNLVRNVGIFRMGTLAGPARPGQTAHIIISEGRA